MVNIRRVRQGDENILAYIQTESWKAAFKDILPKDTLLKYTRPEQATNMYKTLLEKNIGNGYILEVEGNPHCIAYWDETREHDMPGYAELICIHSLQDKWHQGYGSLMMKRVLEDIEAAGYDRVMLWVFEDNYSARRFYEKHGFISSGKKKPALDAVEEMYIKE